MSSWCRDVVCEVGLVPGLVRRSRGIVGTCSAKTGYSRDVLGDVGVVSERIR